MLAATDPLHLAELATTREGLSEIYSAYLTNDYFAFEGKSSGAAYAFRGQPLQEAIQIRLAADSLRKPYITPGFLQNVSSLTLHQRWALMRP